MWRARKSILPTNYNLKLRKVTTEDKCVVYGKPESSGHILWDCVFAVDVWKETRLNLPKFQNPQRDFIDVAWRLRDVQSEVVWEIIATMAWCLWKNRNSVKYEGKGKPTKAIAREAKTVVEEFHMFNSTMSQESNSRRRYWTPPLSDWYKVNVDEAVFKEINSYSIGVVIRNDKGQLMRAMSKKLELPLGALEVEAKAVEEGAMLAKDFDLSHIIIEGDAQTVMSALAGHTSPPSTIQNIIARARQRTLNFSAWKATHVRRNCNQAAHLMARNAKFISESIIWVEDTPPVIETQIAFDVRWLGSCPS